MNQVENDIESHQALEVLVLENLELENGAVGVGVGVHCSLTSFSIWSPIQFNLLSKLNT